MGGPTSAYDANGNIIGMTQYGLKLNASPIIDQLTYTPITNSNKLLKVVDAITTDNKLGDFYDGTSGTGNDYNYDANGNLTLDNNKAISSITYNHLNLPSVITVTGKGSITYTYDAGGNKQKKVTQENNASVPYNGTSYTTNITTTTTYIGGLVYEAKSYSNGSLSSLNYTDVLQFMGQEEGRIRFIPVAGSTPASLRYDYFIKDHLGNVRMVLTEVSSADIPNYYPAATLEGTYDATTNSMVNYEKQFYDIDNTKITLETSIPSWGTETVANTKLYYNNNGNPPPNLSYPSGCTPVQTTGSTKLYKLNATTNKTGLEFMIKVMAGDHIDIFGKSYYLNTTNITNANSTTLNLLSLMTNFLLAPANPAAGKGFTASTLNTINSGVIPSTFFRGSNSEPTTQVPKAYINYIFLDEQFKYAGGNFSRVGASGLVKDHWQTDAVLQNITVPKNGYIFVYVSNESNFDVFFDNLQVIHKPGPVLEETHYYPFGLTMTGISSKAAGGIENKHKYNGIELDTSLGLNEYEAELRDLDPQTGRWWQIDPETENQEMWSPYTSNYDNPILYQDPRGNEGEACCGGFIDKIMLSASGAVFGAANTLSFGLISSDPFNITPNLTNEEKMYFNNARTVGKIAPLLSPGSHPSEVPEVAPSSAEAVNFNTSKPSSTEVPKTNTSESSEPSTGVNLTIKAKPTWNSNQMAQAQAKADHLSKAETVVTKNPEPREANLRSKFIKAGGEVKSTEHVDHPVDLQLGGTNSQPLQALDASVNTSFGAQIKN
ncbi:MAG: RHS repeat-associated core domain-containing protein, partial [Ginsengibacter sp.]